MIYPKHLGGLMICLGDVNSIKNINLWHVFLLKLFGILRHPPHLGAPIHEVLVLAD